MSTDEEKDDLDLWIEEHEEPPGAAPAEASAPAEEASPALAEALALAEEVSPPTKSVGDDAWDAVLASYVAALTNEGKKAGGLGQLRSGAKTAIRWLVSKGFAPDEVTTDQVAPLTAYIDTILKPPMTYVAKRAGAALIEEAVMMKSRPPHTVKPAPPAAPAPSVAPAKKREEMAQQPPEEVEEQYEEQEEEQEEPSQGQVQKARRTAPRPQQVYVMAPAPRAPRQAPRAPTGPSAGVRRVLGPNTGTVRIHRRGPRGQRVYIEDVPVSDINGPMARYLKEYIEPNQIPDPSGYATYEVSEVGADGQEKGQPQPISVQSEMSTDTNEPIAQARQVLDFMSQVREDEEARKGHGSEVLKAAQAKAATSGDTNSLVLMMMMERMLANNNGNQGSSEAMMMKLLETFKRGNGPSFDMPHYPPPPPPMMMPPPPPPQPSELGPIVTKLLEVTVAPKEQKPEKTFMEQMKELMAFKELMAPTPTQGPSAEMIMLRSEMAAIRAQMQPKAAEGGIEGALNSFTRLSEVVKTIAPQINAGGITGALQGVLTPKLQAAVGDMLAGGIMGARAAAQQAAAAAPPAQLPAQGPRSAPAAVVALIPALKAADTEPKQVQATLEVMQGYYSDPGFAPQMEPALQALLQGNREPGVRIVLQVLGAHRPELSKVEFAGKVIDALLASATGQAAPSAPQAEPPKPLATPTATVPLDAVAQPAAVAPTAEVPVTPPAEVLVTPLAEVPAAQQTAEVPAAQQTVEAVPASVEVPTNGGTGPEKPVFATGTPVDPKDMPITSPALAEPEEAGAHA